MRLENSSNQEKWRTIVGLPRRLQRTFIKRVWPTPLIFRASLRFKLVTNHRGSCVQTGRCSSSQRKILFEKYAGPSSKVKYPLMRAKRLSRKMFFSALALSMSLLPSIDATVERACWVCIYECCQVLARFSWSIYTVSLTYSCYFIFYFYVYVSLCSYHIFLNWRQAFWIFHFNDHLCQLHSTRRKYSTAQLRQVRSQYKTSKYTLSVVCDRFLV